MCIYGICEESFRIWETSFLQFVLRMLLLRLRLNIQIQYGGKSTSIVFGRKYPNEVES